MKMRSQIIALGLAGVAATAATGGIGLLSGRHLGGTIGGTIGDVIGTSQALQHSQEADMMHDAVRGDAQLAVLGALQNEPARIDEAQKDLREHGQNFEQQLKALRALTPDATTLAALDAVEPKVRVYLDTASRRACSRICRRCRPASWRWKRRWKSSPKASTAAIMPRTRPPALRWPGPSG